MRTRQALRSPHARLLEQMGRTPLARSLQAAGEIAASELAAARDGLPLGSGGPVRFRKWLGWKLYHVATRVNPEVAEG